MMIGVLMAASLLFFHRTFSPVAGSKLSIRPVSREMPFCSGPRQWGQSSGSVDFFSAARRSAANRVSSNPPTRRTWDDIMLMLAVRGFFFEDLGDPLQSTGSDFDRRGKVRLCRKKQSGGLFWVLFRIRRGGAPSKLPGTCLDKYLEIPALTMTDA